MDIDGLPWATMTPIGAMVGMVWALFRLFAGGAIAFRREVEDLRAQRDAAVTEAAALREAVAKLASAMEAQQSLLGEAR